MGGGGGRKELISFLLHILCKTLVSYFVSKLLGNKIKMLLK